MAHLPPLIADLGLILSVAAVTTIISKVVKQPVVLGYIVAGLLVGPHVNLVPSVMDEKNLVTWSEIGVIFLLFSLGLEFSFRKLMKVGGTAVVTTMVTVSFMMGAGFLTGRALGWAMMDSLFLGGILSMSSTTIIIRAFDELGLKTASFAKVVLGVLVVEDLVAILLLVLLSTVAVSREFSGGALLFEMGKLGFFLVLWFVVGIFLIPSFLKRTNKWMNDETLLIVSVALCLSMVYVAVAAGFSAPLGAFVMGSLLAETTKAERIEHLVKPVKDLFASIFFVSVGMMIDPHVLREHWLPVLVLCVVTLIGQPLSSMSGAVLAGQPLKTAVRAGMSLSQIGEFSFIIATLGLTLNVTSDLLYPVAVAVSAITTFTTPYMIKAGEPMHALIARLLPGRWLAGIAHYSDQSGQVRSISDWNKLLRSYLLNMALHTVIAVAIIALCARVVAPWTDRQGSFPGGGQLTGLITLVALGPSLWAIAVRRIQPVAYRNLWLNRRQLRGPLVALELMRVLTGLLLIGLVVGIFFPSSWAMLAVPLVVIISLVIFRQRLQRFYQRVEKHFLLNLNQRTDRARRQVPALAPWDMHPATMRVAEGSAAGGRTLAELALRERYGVNIARIDRDDRTINLPGANDRILPGDELLVIGTDEQLVRMDQALAQAPIAPASGHLADGHIELLKYRIGVRSPLAGIGIRASRIKELARGLVVGIERDGERLLNPDGAMAFAVDDVVWVVGDRSRMEGFMLGKGEPV
ncbi:MAG TPA: cation:proton antiporter [Flavobacteriales bacterium]|nr:cation:proton antiporter [Flavobacteriales bacterium]